MPAEQNGSVSLYRGSWCARWYDEHGKRRRKRGFRTKTEAGRFLRVRVDHVARLRRGEAVLGGRTSPPTIRELAVEFLAQYANEENSKAALVSRLKHVTGSEPKPGADARIKAASFADLRVDRLTVATVAAWRRHLPAGSAWHIHKALRQVLNYGVAAGYLQRNVAREVPNPEPKRQPVDHFADTGQIDLLAGCIGGLRKVVDPVSATIVVFASETGLRTEEWLALERSDIDRRAGVVHVRRVYVDGKVKKYGKTSQSLRPVPLTARAAAALDRLPPRIDTPLIFPAGKNRRRVGWDCGRCVGGCHHLHLDSWREQWNVALEVAGLHVDEHGRKLKRTPYSLRHTYATWALAAGVPIGDVAEFMGTSIEQLEKTYRHRADDALARGAAALERWQRRNDTAAEGGQA